MLGGFDGMVLSNLLNESDGSDTTFFIIFNNGTTETKTVRDGSLEYIMFIKYAN